MKKLILFFLSIFSLFLLSNVMCQTTVIKYYSFDNNNDTIEPVKTISISTDLYKIENRNMRILYTTYIFRNKDSIISLMNKEKIYFEKNKFESSFKKCNILNVKVETRLFKETKEILGYKCNKASIIVKKEKKVFRNYKVWFTKELANNEINIGGYFEEVPGVILELQNLESNSTVKNIVEKAVYIDNINESTKVEIPNNFLSIEEHNKKLGLPADFNPYDN